MLSCKSVKDCCGRYFIGARMAVAPPPVIELFAEASKREGRWYLSFGIITVLIGSLIVGIGLASGAETANTATFVKLGGGLLSSFSLVPFKMGWYRFERINYLSLLQARWAQVAQDGDPGNEIPELKKMYFKVIQDSLGRTA